MLRTVVVLERLLMLDIVFSVELKNRYFPILADGALSRNEQRL